LIVVVDKMQVKSAVLDAAVATIYRPAAPNPSRRTTLAEHAAWWSNGRLVSATAHGPVVAVELVRAHLGLMVVPLGHRAHARVGDAAAGNGELCCQRAISDDLTDQERL
jgi:hypothetical protein